MRIIDLTHPLYDGLEGYPGSETVRIKVLLEIPNGGYHVSTLYTDAHTGTHIDMPRHVFENGQSIESLELEKCIGPAVLVSLEKKPGEEITPKDLEPLETEISAKKRVIIATGWSDRFGTPAFYQNFPGISMDTASWLLEKGVVLLGLEQPSVHATQGLELHHKLLENGVIIVEALKSPGRIPTREFQLICLPLCLQGCDGAPARAVAIIE